MIIWFRDLLYGSSAAAFPSAFGLEDSVARLQAATGRNLLSAIIQFREMTVGRVSASRVSLYRMIPLVGNSFAPVFEGRFNVHDGRVVLEGQFTMKPFTKVGMSIWFGFIALWTCMVTIPVVMGHREARYFPLFGLGMIGLGVLLVGFGKWWARNDQAWLSERISSALAVALNPTTSKPIG